MPLTLVVFDAQANAVDQVNVDSEAAADGLILTKPVGLAKTAQLVSPGGTSSYGSTSSPGRVVATYANPSGSAWFKNGVAMASMSASVSVLPLILGASALGLILYFVFRKKG